MIPVDACFNWKANNFLLEKVSWGTTRVIIYMDSKLLVPAVCFAELTGFNWIMGHLVRATCTVVSIFAQTSQEGFECSKAER